MNCYLKIIHLLLNKGIYKIIFNLFTCIIWFLTLKRWEKEQDSSRG